MIEHGLNAKSIAEQEVRGQLEGMATLVDLNKSLSDENEALRSERDSIRKELDTVQAQVAEEGNLRDERDAMRKENIALKSEIVALRKRHCEEIADLQSESWRKLLEVVKARQ